MQKDFDQWSGKKKSLHERRDTDHLYFRERDIWWCSLGVNVGFEQDGKGESSQRPVLVLRKFNRHVMLVLPLTTRSKPNNKYYISFIGPDGLERSAVLSQIRLIDIRRLNEHLFMLDEETFMRIKKATLDVIADRFLELPPRKKRGEPEGHL
ncbi:MAG: type II toxin-antitoxin system PemK/MazF family toxin [bacterium]|nr:type II toxin-antitoxin system PemK/MazF family toxin [bacterium]